MNTRIASVLFVGFIVLAACTSPTATPPTPTQPVFVIPTFFPTDTFIPLSPAVTADGMTALPGITPTVTSSTTDICTDLQVQALIESLKTATLNSDGELLASLISPASGMDVRFFRYGTVVNYDQAHAKFLFESTYELDWGAEPGSGASKVGSFHDVVVPKIVEGFNQTYTLYCNDLKHGGASYDVMWLYDKGFYSVYFAGTETNGNLDWHTWAVGIEHVDGKPYIYALSQYFWEP